MRKLLIIILMLSITLSMALSTSCKDKSADDFINRLEKESYDVHNDEYEEIEEWFEAEYDITYDIDNIEKFITAIHTEEFFVVHIAYCKSVEAAIDLENTINENSKNIYEEWDFDKSDFECIRNENKVFFGYKGAVNIAI